MTCRGRHEGHKPLAVRGYVTGSTSADCPEWPGERGDSAKNQPSVLRFTSRRHAEKGYPQASRTLFRVNLQQWRRIPSPQPLEMKPYFQAASFTPVADSFVLSVAHGVKLLST